MSEKSKKSCVSVLFDMLGYAILMTFGVGPFLLTPMLILKKLTQAGIPFHQAALDALFWPVYLVNFIVERILENPSLVGW